MGYTHFDKVSGNNGLFAGKKGSEVQVASATGGLYQSGTAITATAAELNIMDGITKTTAQLNQAFATIAGSTGTGTAIPNAGVAAVSSTGGAMNYVLADPTAAGDKVTIICTAGSTDNTVVITTASTGCTLNGTNRVATMNAADDSLELIALSTTRWFINVNNGSVALS